jgi:hypothetical protein
VCVSVRVCVRERICVCSGVIFFVHLLISASCSCAWWLLPARRCSVPSLLALVSASPLSPCDQLVGRFCTHVVFPFVYICGAKSRVSSRSTSLEYLVQLLQCGNLHDCAVFGPALRRTELWRPCGRQNHILHSPPVACLLRTLSWIDGYLNGVRFVCAARCRHRRKVW